MSAIPPVTPNPGNLVLATYSVTVRSDAPTGTVTLAFDTTNTQVASINSDVNVVGDMTSTSTTIATTTVSPTPTGTADKCGGADISANGTSFGQDGKVSSADYNYLITKWTGSFNSCPNNDCGGADISANGTSFGQDGKVSSADYNYMITKWTGSFASCQ
jgi:hypothetical protein